MALRRANRTIETFDISLMAVVTKAMGAFLVLMLLLVPSYVGMPELQKAVETIETETRQTDERIATLARRKEELEKQAATEGPEERTLALRIAELERENDELKRPIDEPRSQSTTLVFILNWAGCDGEMDLYVHGVNHRLEDGREWPEVRLGKQAHPPGILEIRNRPDIPTRTIEYENFAIGLLGLFVTDLRHRPMIDAVRRHTRQGALVAVNNVAAGARFGVYGKTWDIKRDCRVQVGVLPTAEPWIGKESGHAWGFGRATMAPKGTNVIILGWFEWSGSLIVGQVPTARDEVALKARLGLR